MAFKRSRVRFPSAPPVFFLQKRFYGICAQRGAVGVIRLAVLTGEASMKQGLVTIFVIFSVRYFVGQLKESKKAKKLTLLRPVQR